VFRKARAHGRKAGLKVNGRVVRTRNPGAALVDEARRSEAEVIYLATEHAPLNEQTGLGPTASYLLTARPCRVVIETLPGQRRALRPSTGSAIAGREIDHAEPRPARGR